MSTIGFIGLGNMGTPMVTNLLNAKHHVKVFDLNPLSMEHLAAQGAVLASSALEAACDTDFVITMLPNSDIVESIYLGAKGLLEQVTGKPIFIDCSTISPAPTIKIASAANAKGFEFIDAPVSGGIMGAKAGTLCFIVGGEAQTLPKVDAILHVMGKSIIHAGAHGAGQLAKICNNLLAGILMVGTAEALALGVRNGLSAKVLSQIMTQSSGGNFMVDRWNPWPGVLPDVPASNDYKGGFQVQLMLKDLGLAMDCAQTSQASVPLGSMARSLFALHVAADAENRLADMSSIQKLYFPGPTPADA